MAIEQLVIVEREGPVARLTLNRPDRHNSLTPEFLEQLLAAWRNVSQDDGVRAVVLQANGRSFSTGGDAQGFVDHAGDVQDYARRIVGLLNDVILAMFACPVPIVAAVHGIVTGGSLGLLLAADIVLLTPDAWLAPYYSAVGPSPDGGWATLFPRVVGRQRAAWVLFTNRWITADEALAWGLASMIVPADDIRDAALRVAQDIAGKKPGSVRHTRQLLNLDLPEIARLLDAELEHFVEHIATPEALDGFRQFVADRRSRRERVA